MEQESLNKATELVINAIQNSDINIVDKVELLMNISNFLDHYEEAIKSDLGRNKWKQHWKPATKTRTFKRRR